MTDDKPKKYGSAPRQLYGSDPHKAALEDEARLDRAYQRGRDDAAKKALTKAETAAKPLAKPRKRNAPKTRPKAMQAARRRPDLAETVTEAILTLAEPRKKRAPGGGRKNTIGDAWLQFDPPMSRAAWYRQGRPTPPEIGR